MLPHCLKLLHTANDDENANALTQSFQSNSLNRFWNKIHTFIRKTEIQRARENGIASSVLYADEIQYWALDCMLPHNRVSHQRPAASAAVATVYRFVQAFFLTLRKKKKKRFFFYRRAINALHSMVELWFICFIRMPFAPEIQAFESESKLALSEFYFRISHEYNLGIEVFSFSVIFDSHLMQKTKENRQVSRTMHFLRDLNELGWCFTRAFTIATVPTFNCTLASPQIKQYNA